MRRMAVFLFEKNLLPLLSNLYPIKKSAEERNHESDPLLVQTIHGWAYANRKAGASILVVGMITISIKRDDLLGLTAGGNKTAKSGVPDR